MRPVSEELFLKEDSTVLEAVEAMINADTDMVFVVNDEKLLTGIVTNGDLKRNMSGMDIKNDKITPFVHRYPVFVDVSAKAVEALRIMMDKNIHALPVVKDERPVGVIEKDAIIRYGIYL